MVDLDNYKIIKNLGSGAFGSVKLAQHILTQKFTAIKIIKKQLAREQGVLKNIKREGAFLKRFSHPHIVKLYEYIKTDKVHYLILEYVPEGELYNLIEKRGRLSEPEAKKYFFQTLQAVEYCHSHSVAHRDIKPENILLDENKNIKLGDFGLSNTMKDGEFLKTSCGSANYAAPEVVTGQKYCGTDADIWSLGVLLYALLTGTLPFDNPNLPKMFMKNKTASFAMPFHVSATAADLIKKLIVVNPVHRLQVNKIFEHPWLVSTYPCRFLNLPHSNVIDEEVFQGLLTRDVFNRIANTEVLRKNILAGDDYDLFTVSYEILVFSKAKEAYNFANRPKKVFQVEERFRQEKVEAPKDWDYGFVLDNSPDEIIITLCSILKEMGGKWIFYTPFHMKTVLKGESKKFHVKMTIRLCSV